ncbi:MAG: hypothetical protein P4M11_15665, partial [Candidatus Pacebacteria bacterium]|nr:hypothetical protein [Candidatus Paceibacterota bacterium]
NFSGGAISKKDIRKAKSVSLMLDSLKSKKALGAILRTIRMPRWMKLAFITFIMMLTTLAGMAVGGTLLNQSGIDHVQLNVATTMGQNSVACEIELQSYLDFREMLLIASYSASHLALGGQRPIQRSIITRSRRHATTRCERASSSGWRALRVVLSTPSPRRCR